jgi:hypothetical protein
MCSCDRDVVKKESLDFKAPTLCRHNEWGNFRHVRQETTITQASMG